MNVGERIKEKREAKALSQEALADIIQVNRSYIAQIERGSKVPSVILAYEMAKALDCTMDDFVK